MRLEFIETMTIDPANPNEDFHFIYPNKEYLLSSFESPHTQGFNETVFLKEMKALHLSSKKKVDIWETFIQ